MSGVLEGLRVLDFSRVLAGPYATRILADFGAEVIRVEPPGIQDEDSFARAYYAAWNRGKLAVNLNLGIPEGLALARRLVVISDVLVENFTPRVMANWGLVYDNLVKIKRDIIMLSMSVMGQTGPRSDYTGFGPTVHALSGMSYLTTFPGKPPMGPGFSLADHVSGVYGALAVLGALEELRLTGRGQHIDLSETEAMVSLLGDSLLAYQSGSGCGPAGNGSPSAAPHGVYLCQGKDRWCAIAVCTEAEWQAFKGVLGNPAWSDEARFADMASRLRNQAELDRLISDWTAAVSPEDVMARLQAAGIRAGAVQDAADLAHDPQLLARGFFVPREHSEGRILSDAQPIRLSGGSPEYRVAPEHGQHNDYVYGKLLGIGVEEMGGLRDRGVI